MNVHSPRDYKIKVKILSPSCPSSSIILFILILFNKYESSTFQAPGPQNKGEGCALRCRCFLHPCSYQDGPAGPSIFSHARAHLWTPSPSSLPSGDETYLDIFRDFSLMASDDPEKLSRRSHDLHTL